MTSQDGAASTAQPMPPLWNPANIITMLRVALVPVFAVLVLQHTPGMMLAGAVVFLLAALTDKLDGHLARSRNLVTNFGKIADPIADKALVLTALVLLWWHGTVPWWVPVIIIVRELGITLLRFVMIRRSVIAASSGGKLKTVLQVVFITGLLVPWHELVAKTLADVLVAGSWIVLVAALVVTVATGLDYVVRAWRLAHTAEEA